MSRQSMRSGDTSITGQREVEPASHAVAVDRGNCRDRKVGHGAHQSLPHLRKGKSFWPREGCDLVEVCSGGEEACIADDHQARRRMARQFFNDSSKGFYSGACQAISFVAPKPAVR